MAREPDKPPSLQQCRTLVEQTIAPRPEEIQWQDLGDALDALEQVDRYRRWTSLAARQLVKQSRTDTNLEGSISQEEWARIRQVKLAVRAKRLRDKYWGEL